MRARIATFVIIVQSILFAAHWFIYTTWTSFLGTLSQPGISALQWTLALLSISFVAATLLAHRYSNPFVRGFYRAAATWLGLLNFLFLAACACWIIFGGARLLGLHPAQPIIAELLFGLALCAGLYGVVNARLLRVKRIRVKLPNLPASWRGRIAALVSDVHLGPVNGFAFLRRIVSTLQTLAPDIVFVTGDLYDGTQVNARHVVSPWKELTAPLGAFFVTGNHEEFSDPAQYLNAVAGSGVRVLNGEKVVIDGLQILGVPFASTTNGENFRSVLRNLNADRAQPSILLSHAPHSLPVAEEAGISLQLSGHTHGGQIFPFTWFTKRIFGLYTYGLAKFGSLLVYTSTGAGTWGPPMRVGTHPEIVLIEFA